MIDLAPKAKEYDMTLIKEKMEKLRRMSASKD
jgi:hypothetical protein